MRGAASLERNWGSILIQMKEDPVGSSALKRVRSESEDRTLTIAGFKGRYPVWAKNIAIGLIRDHFEAFDSTLGRVREPDSCPVCDHDARNRKTHGIERKVMQ